jgi:hypothetical protein
MARHGKFDAVALLHRSAHTSVWSARPAGAAAAPPNHCLKLVELSAHELADHDATNAEHLLIGAALQQSMADKSDGWAPIYELGTDDGTEAFYVTKLYPRSAQSLIDARNPVSSVDLRSILIGVVDALLDLETACGRPHANLKPTNVLLGDTLRAGQVVLTDPGALSENVPSLTRAPDTKAIGQLLYALVTHRPHTGARWPLARGDAWRALGASGKQWFALCEALVNPFGETLTDLTELRARIGSISTSRRRMPRAAVAVPVVAAVAVVAYLGRHQIGQAWQVADKQLAQLTQSKKSPAHHPSIDLTSRPSLVAGPSAPRGLPGKPPESARPGVPAKPDVSATLAGLSIGPVVNPPAGAAAPPASGGTPSTPAPVVVAQAAPVSPPVPAPPAVAPGNNGSVNRRALAVVRDWSPPDFRSDSAQSAFEEGRKQFVASHDNDDAAVTLAQWEGISTRLRLAGDAYPPVDVATTAGWPVAVADQVAARREQVLARAVSAAFDQASFDPTPYHKLTDAVRAAVSAAATARRTLAGGSSTAARSAVNDFQNAVKVIATADVGVADAMSASATDLDKLTVAETAGDRDKLLATADDEQAPLAVRASAWLRAGQVKTDKQWPADFAGFATDQNRGTELAGLLHDQVATTSEHQVVTENDRRLAAYMGTLRDQPAVAAAATQACDPQYADLVARCPAWFRFDVALATARRTSAAAVKPDDRQRLVDAATAANVPAATAVIDLLNAGDRRAARSLAEAGPASTGGWRLHAGWSHDRCTYDATNGSDQSIEFLRVHVSDAGPADATDLAGIDCYVSATAVPVSLMSHLLADDASAVTAAQDLNGPPATGVPSLWKFDDTDPSHPVAPDGDGYRKWFMMPVSDRLPAQRVTPLLAMYLARRAGCRLPSSTEWQAAWAAAKTSPDPVARGFALQGWKLRTDASFTALLANGGRDGAVSPMEGAFVPVGSSNVTDVWTAAAAAKLGGHLAGDPPSPVDAWPLSTPETTDGFGFRPVGGTDDYAGVFHDLVGNVGQLVIDVPGTLAEQLADGKPTAAGVKGWFTPDRLSAVSVVGGSAVSPPAVDPTKPYPLAAGGGSLSFSDVGFRLAFTDPAARPAEAWTALRRMPFATAP